MDKKIKLLVATACMMLALFVFAQKKTKETPPTPRIEYSMIVDLTQKISEKSPNWEGLEKSPFEATTVGTYDKDGYFAREFKMPEHFSTHIDAPAHFARGVWTVDQIPPERLVAPLVVLDVTEQCSVNRDYQITLDDLARWEKANQTIPQGSIVIASTGWAKKFNNMKDYRGAGADGVMHFPGFSLEAAKFLVDQRGIYAIGIDTMSIDPGNAANFPVHHYTLPRNVYQIENVGDLSKAPDSGAIVVAAPIKLEGGSGGPARILVMIK